MSRPSAPDTLDDTLDDEAAQLAQADPAGVATAPPLDLSSLPIAGLTRRRMAVIASALLAVWIVIAFTRQVAEASEAATRAQGIAVGNSALRLEVAAMERELDAIARQRFVEQQARAYGVGGEHETAFSLVANAPALAPDAPGSAAVRTGSDADHVPPLERWLTVLFGPSL